jgi:NAD-reducing hydrogenase small subunit
MTKIRLATTWLDGCSGCHMSLLDTDERLLELVRVATIVYSPLVDTKEFPEDVDVTLVEGGVSSEEDEAKVRLIRARTRLLVAFGDCAINGNVSAMRNQHSVEDILHRAYVETADAQPRVPDQVVPPLFARVRPVHEVVPVDVHLPGCPPPADLIFDVLVELCAGRAPELAGRVRFG